VSEFFPVIEKPDDVVVREETPLRPVPPVGGESGDAPDVGTGATGASAAAPNRLTPDQIAAELAQNEAMFWWIAKQYTNGLTEHDIEDVTAAVRLQFVVASQTFDTSLGLKLSTYAMSMARTSAWTTAQLIRRRGVHTPGNLVGKVHVLVPLEWSHRAVGCAPGDAISLGDLVPDRPHAEAPVIPPNFWERLTSSLDGRDRDAFLWSCRDNLTLRDIGGRLGISGERCRQLIVRAKNTIRLCPSARRLWESMVE
jgi:RNA polymerase sigma factor (sigma-70 family)